MAQRLTVCHSNTPPKEPTVKDTQHTPGPWHLSECAHQTTDTGICSESGLHITDVTGYGMRDDQNQANARLIASAPDMLNLLASADRLEELTGDNLAVYARTFAALARAAISKATGQA